MTSLILVLLAYAPEFAMHTLATGFWAPSGTCIADLNTDGHLDLIASGWNCNEISYWLNSGESTPEWERHLVTDSLDEASFCDVGDVNSDGYMDVAACGWEAGKVLLFIGSESLDWTESVIDEYPEAHEIHLVDIDQDGALDAVAAGAGDVAVAWWRNTGGTPDTWVRQDICSDMNGGRSVCWGDFDSDGDIDLAGCALACDDVRWWENSGGPSPVWTQHLIQGYFNGAHMLRACDIDCDGHIDLAGAAFLSGRPRIWMNSGSIPVEWEEHQIPDDIGLAMGVDLPDLNSDGLPDLAATSLNPHQISVWINNGGSPSTWEKTLVDGTIAGTWPLASGDLDSDGDMDLVAGANEAGYIRWYQNQQGTGCSEGSSSELRIEVSNPAWEHAQITVKPGEVGTLSISVLDLTGRTVAQLYNGNCQGSEMLLEWDGTICREGVYLIRAETSSGAMSVRKVTLLN